MTNLVNDNPWAEKEQKTVSFEKIAQSLLTNPEIMDNPDVQDKGRAVVDRFVGALLRQGNVTNSAGQDLTPADILNDFQTALDLPENRLAQMQLEADPNARLNLTHLTSKQGLRGGFDTLLRDPRTRAAAQRMTLGLESEKLPDGQLTLTMTTQDQLKGYLEAQSGRKDWTDVLMSKAQTTISGEDKPGHRWHEMDNIYLSGEPDDEQNARIWHRSVLAAKTAGVDMKLLERSVDRMEHYAMRARAEAAGRAALYGM